MSNSTLAQIDAIIFRLTGCIVGIGGAISLLINNPLGYLFTNTYGIIFLAIFTPIGFFSSFSLIKQLAGGAQ